MSQNVVAGEEIRPLTDYHVDKLLWQQTMPISCYQNDAYRFLLAG